MKIKSGIIILIGLVISNSTLAQDTTHERLVDKFYPKAEQAPPVPNTVKANPITATTTQPAPVNAPIIAVPLQKEPTLPGTEKANPVTNTTMQSAPTNTPVTAVPLSATVIAPTPAVSEPVVAPINEISNEVAPVTQTASQVQTPQSPINNQVGKINKSPINNAKKGTDNSNPATPIYRDTRLGSSSPLYNTYEKNDNGAGSITTNPNKG